MEKFKVSWPRFLAFVSIVITYLIIIAILMWLDSAGWKVFREGEINGVQDLLITAPAVAFYIVVALAALAGWARGPAMFRDLGFHQTLQKQLQKQGLSSSTIQNQIRGSVHSVQPETPLKEALHDGLVARLRILPVIDNDKVNGVITMYDVSKRIDEELKNQSSPLLDNLQVSHLNPKKPIACRPSDKLSDVLHKMITNRRTKLIVQNDDDTLVGTLDLFDVVSELLREDTEGTASSS